MKRKESSAVKKKEVQGGQRNGEKALVGRRRPAPAAGDQCRRLDVTAQSSGSDDDALDSDERGRRKILCRTVSGFYVSDGLNHRIVELDRRDPDLFQRHAGGSTEG